jgi:hypothetical protein
MRRFRLFLFLLGLSVLAAESRAVIITLTPSKDAAIYSLQKDNSNGGGAGLFVGTDGNANPSRSLISFDLSSIPAGATITEVKLTLTLGQVSGGFGGDPPTNATIGIFEVARNWGEGITGNNTQSSGIPMTGQGFPAGLGDATWNSANHQSVLWTTPGGDHAATASASLFLSNNIVGSAFTWLSTPELIADVQGWLDNPTSNFGWELINANESVDRTAYIFYSRNWPSFPSGNAGQVPMLQITYTIPEPSVAVLLALAAFLVPTRRRPHARAP